MEIEQLLIKLNNQPVRAKYSLLIADELIKTTAILQQRGYKINSTHGLIGEQEINQKDLSLYQYFRDVHFIYEGTRGNWNTNDPSEQERFDKLKAEIIHQLENMC